MASEKRLIDADALISRFCELANRITATDNWFHLDAITDEIMDAPTVDAVEVVHAHWTTLYKVDTWMGTSTIDCFICSECGVSSKRKGNYCHNCCAKMDGDVNGSL